MEMRARSPGGKASGETPAQEGLQRLLRSLPRAFSTQKNTERNCRALAVAVQVKEGEEIQRASITTGGSGAGNSSEHPTKEGGQR